MWSWQRAYVEAVVFETELVEEEMAVYLDVGRSTCRRCAGDRVRTCGFMRTKSMNMTTKSCSMYLSAKRLHRGHCVNRTPLPSARSSALLYEVYSVLTGARHSMQIGIVLVGLHLRPGCERVWVRESRWKCKV